ncbi:MAG: peptidylprolyl isomerase [Thermomicrobiales bacterium]|nr:peptidylprolyl isomerase [Thermomicrobiales bacterium]
MEQVVHVGRAEIRLAYLLLQGVAAATSGARHVESGDARSIPRTMSTRVVIETEAGEIHARLEDGRAPGTVANFLGYVDAGLYDGGRFHRVVRMDNQPHDDIRIEVIQGGVNLERMAENGDPIPLERTSVTGLRHLDGTISMARFKPDSAVSDFFICIGDQPDLDFGGMRNPDGQGFAAFGQVTQGMDVVRAIQAGLTDGQTLILPARIVAIRRV